MDLDLLIKGAAVVDGTGGPAQHADVAVRDGSIVAIGTLPAGSRAKKEVDATGLTLTPGFVDLHTHSDVTLLHDGAGINKVCQGVTTEVTGNCGFSAFPIASERRQLHEDHLAYLGPDVVDIQWDDFDGYVAALEAAHPIQNVACLVGHGTLRLAVAGKAPGPLDSCQESEMRSALELALEQGALGFTTGLTYVPSMFGSTAEITMLAAVASRHDALYATHARGTAGREREAIAEAIEVGQVSGVRVEFSHLALNDPRSWGSAGESLSLFDDARRAGADIQFDVYPYDASASSLSQYLPTWLTTLTSSEARNLLSAPASRQRALSEISQGWYGGIPWMWDRVLVTQSGPGDQESPGHTIEQLASKSGEDPCAVVLRLFEEQGNGLQVAMFYRTEEDMVEFLRHPASVVGSDGVAVAMTSLSERAHPRFYGTFPRVLGRYVREKPILGLEEAVHKMTGEPAERCRIARRGYIKVGYAADLVLFSAGKVADMATFAEPNRLPLGIDQVYVNGQAVVEHGAWNGTSAGRVLRRGQA